MTSKISGYSDRAARVAGRQRDSADIAVKLSRRAFLAALPLAAAVSACRRPYRSEDFVLPARSPVALLPASGYDADFSDVIGRGLALFDLPIRGRRVFLKPNLVEYEAGTVINTHPRVVAGAVEAFLRAGAREVVVGEGAGHRRDIEYLLTATGMSDVLADLRVRFVDLNHDDVARVPLASRFTGLSELSLPVELLKSDVIVSMPKLKTHHWAGLTASMKNFFGVVPGQVPLVRHLTRQQLNCSARRAERKSRRTRIFNTLPDRHETCLSTARHVRSF